MVAITRVLLLAALALLVASPARADRITAGALIYPSAGSSLSVMLSSDDFTFDGRVSVLGGVFMPWLQCLVPECHAGDSVDLLAHWSGSDLPGTATVGDQTFTNVGSLAGTSSLFATWTGTLDIPAAFESGILTAPFNFTGRFFFEPTPGVFSTLDLVGNGTATATFQPYSGFPGALLLESLRYDFEAEAAATPEPASMILLGTGLAGILAARARRKRSR